MKQEKGSEKVDHCMIFCSLSTAFGSDIMDCTCGNIRHEIEKFGSAAKRLKMIQKHFDHLKTICTSPIQLAEDSLDCTEERTATTLKKENQKISKLKIFPDPGKDFKTTSLRIG